MNPGTRFDLNASRDSLQCNVSQDSLQLKSSSSSRSSDGNSILLNEGGSASQAPQASVELEDYGSVV